MIEVKDLVKRYGNHMAVDHLSFTVEDGQIYGFLGPNGAGKSTTMNIITGYIAASEGTVLINGHDILKDAEKAKKSIGYLPELPPVYQDMTVYEYLRFVAELKKVDKPIRKAQIEEIMDLTDISDMSSRLIKNLSKGYRQRVGLAQAIIGYPDVIILDEPMVGLDPKQIMEIRDLILSLGKKHTIILSSHILSEISAVCDHIMIISKGKLVASDSPEGLQKLIQSKQVLEVTVKADITSLKETLSSISEITSVEERDSTIEDCVTVLLETENNIDIREKLSMKLLANHMMIMGMNLVEHSLEDIFLELTEEERQEDETKNDSDI